MINKLPILSIFLFFLIGKAHTQHCSNDGRYTELQFFDSTEIVIGVNIQYGIAQDYLGNLDTLLMDVYYPNLAIDTAPARPFVMLFHGGGFSSGDKQAGDIRDLCIHLALRGFVCASVNYRLGHDFSEYGQYKARYRAIQDGNAALRYIVNNANSLRIDTSWLFVGGQSAGSLLALGMVYADQTELDSVSLLYNPTATSVELGGLNSSGNSLNNLYSIKGIFNNWGGVTASEIDVDEMLPTIAFHGLLDTLVRIGADTSFAHYTLDGSQSIYDKLINNNICSELVVDTLGEHGIFRNASSVFRAQKASCFFKSIFCNNCASFYTLDSIPSNCSSSPNLSVEEYNLGANTKVYPNPFEDVLNIEGLDGGKFSIYNYLGQIVYEGKVSHAEIKLDLAPGIYFINIEPTESKKTFSHKLIRK